MNTNEWTDPNPPRRIFDSFDCIVVGSGHAGSCAALAAHEAGCGRVLVVDRAPEEWVGGNGYFTAGAHRVTHEGLADLLSLVNNVSPSESVAEAKTIDIEPYTRDDFARDILRLSDGRSDRRLVDALVDGSRDAAEWLKRHVGVQFELAFHRQAYEVDGRQKFWGGLVLSVVDGGKGLIEEHQKALRKAGIETWFDTDAVLIAMNEEDHTVSSLRVRRNGTILHLGTPNVILACGGFEASQTLRIHYMGWEWQHVRVRGTPYNNGCGIHMAAAVGAALAGDFSSTGCHSTCWDANAPASGDRDMRNQYTKSGYPLGLMINTLGKRFVDEGEDFRNYTYARFGRAILLQPGGVIFQVFDRRATDWLRAEEYGDGVVKKVVADTVDELALKLVTEGLEDPGAFVGTINAYNAAVAAHRIAHPNLKWNPSVKDGLSTECPDVSLRVEPTKSNWALPLDEPPFLAVNVTCGITFTFGGLAVEPHTANVCREGGDVSSRVIPGLYCCGELMGGLFYGNYPGGSGLTSGAVFGRKAGYSAARRSEEIRRAQLEKLDTKGRVRNLSA